MKRKVKLIRSTKLLIVISAISIWNVSNGQNFSQLVDITYDFIPHQLSKQEQQEIFPKLDSFFNLVIKDTLTYKPLLKKELLEDGHFPYFYYDGAHLLMMLNKENKKDDDLIIESFKKAEIKDLNPQVFTFLLTKLSLRGANTTDIALSILKDSNFSFFIPEHSFMFGQSYCISYILLPLEQKLYISKLIEEFDSSTDLAKKSILTTLWFGYSCDGDTFLDEIKNDPKYSKDIRQYVSDLQRRKKVEAKTKKFMSDVYGDDLNKILIESFSRFTDEAIGNIDYVTRMRRQNESCQ